jgi:hypothetical protein
MNGWSFEYVCRLPQSVRQATWEMLKEDQSKLKPT